MMFEFFFSLLVQIEERKTSKDILKIDFQKNVKRRHFSGLRCVVHSTVLRESVSQKSFPLPIVESASFREMIGHKTCLQSATRLVFSWSSVLFIRSVFNVKLFIINVENESYRQNL